MRTAAGVVILLAQLAGCAAADGPVAIQTLPDLAVCEAARVGGTLVSDPSFGLALQNSGYRQGAVWPHGYSARRESGVTVLLGPSGQVVAREGDRILAAGGSGAGDAVNVECDIEVNPSPSTGFVSGTDPRLGACGGPIGNVRAAFDLAHARDLWNHIPGFLGAPELEIDDPAHVVVYDAPMKMDITGKPRASGRQTFDHVVCVAIHGDQTYYSSVDLSVVKP
jgi:hypothetical protein